MTPQRWRRVDDLFHQAAELPAGERESLLAAACGPDRELLEEVRGLLASDESARGVVADEIQGAILEFHAGDPPALSRHIGPYRLTGELGRGGMGTVYLAERADDQYQGEVAIKVVRPGMDTEFFLSRFRRERQTLARLQHPNIARLLDSGTTEDGLPFIVMERIDGKPIDTYCREERLDIEQVLRLFLPVCAAVAHAHQNLVVHRDLKPGNILVDTTGAPKLLDFGICKLLLGEPSGGATLTGAVMMTPNYASPEQVRGDPITVASDIYSLGAVLYELLTGERCHSIQKYTPGAVERAICGQDVRRPSTAVRDRARAGRLDGDLDNILLKALQKDPVRRYASVEQFAMDIQRHLEYLPVTARPDTLSYRARKFARRNRGPIAAGMAVTLALGAGVVVSAREASIARNHAAQARKLANALIFDVHDRVRDLPGSLGAREAIVRTGLGYLDSLAASAPRDTQLRLDLASAYERMGAVQGDVLGSHMGDTAGALASYRKGLAVLGPVSDSASTGSERVLLLRRIGDVLAYTGHETEALSNFDEAIRIGNPLHERYPGDDAIRTSLADAYDARSRTERGMHRTASATADESVALRLFREALAVHPGDRSIRASIASSVSTLGASLVVQAGPGQLEEAKRNFQEAVAEWDQLCGADPTNMNFQRQRMLAYSHLGDVLGNPTFANLGDSAGAVAAFHTMLTAARTLYDTNPADVGALTDYGMALMRVASIPAQSVDQRAEMYRKSAALLNQAAAKNPANTQILTNAAATHLYLGDLLAGNGRPKEAFDEYRKGHAIAAANLGASLAARQVFVSTARQLAEDAARRGDVAGAMSYARNALAATERESAAPNASVAARSLAFRAYAGMGAVYELLRQPAEARRWRERALGGLQKLQGQPGFGSNSRREMQSLENALKRK